MKNELIDIRLELSKFRKMIHLELKLIWKISKKDKARDPNGLVIELFKKGVAGNIFAKFCNTIKEENYVPEFIKNADGATIFKEKWVTWWMIEVSFWSLYLEAS